MMIRMLMMVGRSVGLVRSSERVGFNIGAGAYEREASERINSHWRVSPLLFFCVFRRVEIFGLFGVLPLTLDVFAALLVVIFTPSPASDVL